MAYAIISHSFVVFLKMKETNNIFSISKQLVDYIEDIMIGFNGVIDVLLFLQIYET